MQKKVLLVILDGWGINPDPKISAVAAANTPFFDQLQQNYPHATLTTHGKAAGLPEGQMGNSEVGHMNLGAGRIVYQDLLRIDREIESGGFMKNSQLLRAVELSRSANKPLHLLGVLSDGGIHGHLNHIKACITLAAKEGLKDVFVNAFTDGRDSDPNAGLKYLNDLQQHLKQNTGQLATICGRFYAMDRDKRWERTSTAYNALVKGKGELTQDPASAVEKQYREGVSDEFLQPIICSDQGMIKNGDTVIFTNFRSDRARQLTEVLTQKAHPKHNMYPLQLNFFPFKTYDKEQKGLFPVFSDERAANTLGEVLSYNNKTQLRIAETEKYAHVTYFFNNGVEQPYPHEKRIIVPSPRDVKQYSEKPEMSAQQLTEKVIEEIKINSPDFICLNFANPDMVAHSGSFAATVKACEVVDACAKEVAEYALQQQYTVFVLADHGNADNMVNADGSANTSHSLNPVPLIIAGENRPVKIKNGNLSDIAPTILSIMGIPVPAEMTGRNLLSG